MIVGKVVECLCGQSKGTYGHDSDYIGIEHGKQMGVSMLVSFRIHVGHKGLE